MRVWIDPINFFTAGVSRCVIQALRFKLCMGSDVPLSVLEAFVEIENTYVDVL